MKAHSLPCIALSVATLALACGSSPKRSASTGGSGGEEDNGGSGGDGSGGTAGSGASGTGGAGGGGTGGDRGGGGGTGGDLGGSGGGNDASLEEDAMTMSPDGGDGTGGSGAAMDCGDPIKGKAGVTAMDYCTAYARVCMFGQGGHYANMNDCVMTYGGHSTMHKAFGDGTRACVAYTICAIENHLLKPSICSLPDHYRCPTAGGSHRDDSPPAGGGKLDGSAGR
jgi:hypothetical protein